MTVDIAEKFASFSERWRPKVIAELNGQEVKVAKIKGEFVWHKHEVDEMFLVWRGSIVIEMRDCDVRLSAGQCYVVPRGVEHRPVAKEEAEVVVFEPTGVRNTGDAFDPLLTAEVVERI